MTEERVLKLQKVASVRIFEQAVEQIRESILKGDLAPGQRLPTEQELCRQLNASRSSVREALRVLEAEGLVEVKRGSGTYVSDQPAVKLSRNEVMQWLGSHEQMLEQVLEVRESIEGLAASLTAQRASAANLEEIGAIIEEQSRIIEQLGETQNEAYDALAELDTAFHLAISGASGNDIAHEIIARVVPSFTQSNKLVLYVSQRMQDMEAEHEDIYRALVARDPQAAEKAMREHLARVRRQVIEIKASMKQ